VGQTSRKLKERLNNHKSDIICRKSTAIAEHFSESLRNYRNLTIRPIYNLSGLSIDERNKMENEYMQLLNTIYPKGLNHYPLV
jgi:phage-related protein